MRADEKVQIAVKDLMGKYVKAYRDKDVAGMIKLFVEDEDLVVIGTGEDEWIRGSKQLRKGFKRDMDQADDIEVTFRDVTISNAGKVAWASCHMNFLANVEGEEVFLPGRLSAVFEEKNGEWLFCHAHYSLPAMEQEEGSAWPG